MTYRELCQRLASVYDQDEARAVVRLLLGERFGLSMADILCDKVTELSADDRTELEKMMRRLEKGEPVQYVLGSTTFCGRRFFVDSSVLIPRPETEELCRWVISEVQENEERGTRNEERGRRKEEGDYFRSSLLDSPSSILDIGTGSGCIAITLAAEMPEAQVTAWDISEEALALARKNADSIGVNVDFKQVDILESPIPWGGDGGGSIIISNPPYVCKSEKAAMERNVLEHEPHLALFVPDNDPLLFYRVIADFARHALKPDGWLYFEINPTYADDLVQMLREMQFDEVTLKADSFGKNRFLRTKIK